VDRLEIPGAQEYTDGSVPAVLQRYPDEVDDVGVRLAAGVAKIP
jgi:hypothetical protein